jgi:hypothetical protein
MKPSEIALKLSRVCKHFLKRYYDYDEIPLYEYTKEDVKKTRPAQVIYSVYRSLSDHAFPHKQRLEHVQEILDNPYAQQILRKASFGERFLHIAKCVLKGNFKDITKSPAELMAHNIKKMFNNEKIEPKRVLEFSEPPQPVFKSMLPKGGLFEQRKALAQMSFEQFTDKYFMRFEGKR